MPSPPLVSIPITVVSVDDGTYVAQAGIGVNTQISPFDVNGEDQSNPITSPDGTMVLFDSNFPGPNGEGQIKWVPAGGGSETVLSPNDTAGPYFLQPSWRPDSGGVIYIHGDPVTLGFEGDIVAVDLSAPGTETVLFSPSAAGTGGFRPQYSPDGTQIAFLLSGGTTPANEGLYVMDDDGSNLTQIDSWGNPGYAGDGEQFAWSPDGSLIAYWASPDSFGTFYVIEPDGSNKTKISIGLTDTNTDFGGTGDLVQKRMSNRAWISNTEVVAAAMYYDGSFGWAPWRYNVDGVTDEVRLSDEGPNGTEYFSTVYVWKNRIWFIPTRTPAGIVASTALDGTDYRVEATLGVDLDGSEFLNGSGLNFIS